MAIHTDRLLLRPITIDDFETHARIVGDADVMQYIHDGALTPVQAWWNIARYLGHWQIRGYGMFVVVEKSSGDVVGQMGFLNPEAGRGFEVGWILAREAWGKGYASEGARALVEHASAVLGVKEVVAVIHADNAASIHVAEKLGGRIDREEIEKGKRLLIFKITTGSAR